MMFFPFSKRNWRSTEKKYDFIVLDPPAFVKSSAKIKEAVKAYRELNEMSMRLIKPGGLLATSSCSYHLSKDMFIDMLQSRRQEREAQSQAYRRCARKVLTIRCCYPCLRQSI